MGPIDLIPFWCSAMYAKLGQENLLRMVRWMRWHCLLDTGFEIRALAIWGWTPHLSVAERPHNVISSRMSREEIFCFFETWRPEWGSNPRSLTFQWISFNHCTMALLLVITDYVCDTESVIIAIRKVVPQISGARTIDCAMKRWCWNSISQFGQHYYLKMWIGLYLFCYNQYQCSQVTASSLDQWLYFMMTYLHLIGITLELKRQHL